MAFSWAERASSSSQGIRQACFLPATSLPMRREEAPFMTLSVRYSSTRRAYSLPSMREKVEAQIALAESIRAVDQRGVVEKVLSSHFLPDIMGNSRAFSKQKVRCTKCGSKYRRIPLTGKCEKCGGNLILSVSKGSVTKYLEISQELIDRYPISPYLRQRLEIQEFGIKSLFESDKSKVHWMFSSRNITYQMLLDILF